MSNYDGKLSNIYLQSENGLTSYWFWKCNCKLPCKENIYIGWSHIPYIYRMHSDIVAITCIHISFMAHWPCWPFWLFNIVSHLIQAITSELVTFIIVCWLFCKRYSVVICLSHNRFTSENGKDPVYQQLIACHCLELCLGTPTPRALTNYMISPWLIKIMYQILLCPQDILPHNNIISLPEVVMLQYILCDGVTRHNVLWSLPTQLTLLYTSN